MDYDYESDEEDESNEDEEHDEEDEKLDEEIQRFGTNESDRQKLLQILKIAKRDVVIRESRIHEIRQRIQNDMLENTFRTDLSRYKTVLKYIVQNILSKEFLLNILSQYGFGLGFGFNDMYKKNFYIVLQTITKVHQIQNNIEDCSTIEQAVYLETELNNIKDSFINWRMFNLHRDPFLLVSLSAIYDEKMEYMFKKIQERHHIYALSHHIGHFSSVDSTRLGESQKIISQIGGLKQFFNEGVKRKTKRKSKLKYRK